MNDAPTSAVSALILMGVSGCGKTTIGRLLSERLGWDFIESDDYHSSADVARMSSGIPLTDEDRQPWLARLRLVLDEYNAHRQPVIMACSALKAAYRRVLSVGLPAVRFVYLKGDYDLILERMRARAGHFMKAGMLRSQFAALQEPPHALSVDIRQPPQVICRMIEDELKLT